MKQCSGESESLFSTAMTDDTQVPLRGLLEDC